MVSVVTNAVEQLDLETSSFPDTQLVYNGNPCRNLKVLDISDINAFKKNTLALLSIQLFQNYAKKITCRFQKYRIGERRGKKKNKQG